VDDGLVAFGRYLAEPNLTLDNDVKMLGWLTLVKEEFAPTQL
jgi:hypothetical protein